MKFLICGILARFPIVSGIRKLPVKPPYRALVAQYPHLKYHVRRACAVAAYTDLYRELDLLPEVSIAEEARDNGSTAIFELIMANPARYRVMNDYTRTVDREFACVIHGICHNTFFAKWWSMPIPLENDRENKRLQRAIAARFIMSNDLSRIPLRPASEIPLAPNLTGSLAMTRHLKNSHTASGTSISPSRRPIANSHIVSHVWHSRWHAPVLLQTTKPSTKLSIFFPTHALLREAEQQPSAFDADDLKRRAELHGGFVETTQDDIWEEDTMVENVRLFNTRLTEVATTDDIRIYSTGPFNGEDTPDVGTVLLNVCAPTSVKSGHTAVSVGEVSTTAGPPLEMPLDIDADLQCRVYLKSALFCNNRPWICRSSAEENI